MLAYILRRILYAIPILFVINVATFLLFFCVNTPEDIARSVLGNKNLKSEMLHSWKKEHFYHYPTFLNTKDTVYYFCSEAEGAKEIPFTSDLRTNKVILTEKDFEKTILKLGEAAKDLNAIERTKNQLSGNVILAINPIGFTKENMNQLKAEFLIYGYPYVLIQTDSESFAEFTSSTVPIISSENFHTYCKNQQAKGIEMFTKTLFYTKAFQLFWFEFGKSDRNDMDIKKEILSRIWPSLQITLPAFFLGLLLNISVAMMTAYCRGSFLDKGTLFLCIIMMSLVTMFYIIIAQFIVGFKWKLLPSSGYQEGIDAIRFIILPVIISLIADLGGGVRFYRTLFLEEINKDFVRTARAKGLSEYKVLFKHVLKSAMIPILTGVIVAIPGLYTGSLLLENFFGIPGMGSFTIEGIESQDFRVVGAMVYLGTVLYIIALILTDIAYTIVDPRVKLK